MVNVNITEIKENKILHRKEVQFEIVHLGQGSPNRLEVRDKLAAMQTAKSELTFIKSMQPVFGLPQIHGMATIYNDDAVAKKLEPDYVHIRNMPKEERETAWKDIRSSKKKKKKT